jgi:hexokinase
MTDSLALLIGENHIRLELVKDGSGTGAALAAYVAGEDSKTVL